MNRNILGRNILIKQTYSVTVLVPLGDNTGSSYRQPLHQVHLWFAAQLLIRYTTCILVLLPGPYPGLVDIIR